MIPKFRKYNNSDIGALVALMAQLGYEHNEESLAKNIRAVRGNNGEVFVAELSGRVCGCVAAIIDVRLAAGTNGEIVSLVVDEAARGRGVGKGLVSIAENWLKEYTHIIRIRANVIREQAHGFYKNLGYALSKTQAIFSKNV